MESAEHGIGCGSYACELFADEKMDSYALVLSLLSSSLFLLFLLLSHMVCRLGKQSRCCECPALPPGPTLQVTLSFARWFPHTPVASVPPLEVLLWPRACAWPGNEVTRDRSWFVKTPASCPLGGTSVSVFYTDSEGLRSPGADLPPPALASCLRLVVCHPLAQIKRGSQTRPRVRFEGNQS